MGWDVPWYSVPQDAVDLLVADRHFGILVSYLRDGDQVFETYRTAGRGNEVMAPSKLPNPTWSGLSTSGERPQTANASSLRRLLPIGYVRQPCLFRRAVETIGPDCRD